MRTLKITLASFAMLCTGLLTGYAATPADNTTNDEPAQQRRGKTTVLKGTNPDGSNTTLLIIGAVDDSDQQDYMRRQALRIFEKTFEKGHQQVRMPKFVITDNKARASFAVGGFVNFRTGYDFNGKVDNLDFVTYNLPMTTTPQNREGLLMDASTSRLFFKTLIRTNNLGSIEAYIETDFRGGGNVLRLRQAYVKFLGITLGQTTSTFTDLSASPNTIDFEGPNAYSYSRNLLVRYQHTFGKTGLSAAIAAEMPVVSALYTPMAQVMPQRIPDIPIYLQYAWNKQSHIRASAIFRNMNYYDAIKDANEYRFGWGVQLSGTANLGKVVNLYGMAIYGKGIGQYIQDLQGNGFDLQPSMHNGQLNTPEVFSWFAAAQFNLTPKLPMTVGYSQVHVIGNGNTINMPAEYKLSQYIVANIFYNINPSLSVGAEYLYGTRYNMNNGFGTGSRVQAMIQLSF